MRPNPIAPGRLRSDTHSKRHSRNAQLHGSVELGSGNIRIPGYRDRALLAVPGIDTVLQIALDCVERIVHLRIAPATANELIPAVIIGRVVAKREPRQPRTAPDELRAQDRRDSARASGSLEYPQAFSRSNSQPFRSCRGSRPRRSGPASTRTTSWPASANWAATKHPVLPAPTTTTEYTSLTRSECRQAAKAATSPTREPPNP